MSIELRNVYPTLRFLPPNPQLLDQRPYLLIRRSLIPAAVAEFGDSVIIIEKSEVVA